MVPVVDALAQVPVAVTVYVYKPDTEGLPLIVSTPPA